MNKTLYEFLATWYYWALTQDEDVRCINNIDPRYGLCSNYKRYLAIDAERLGFWDHITELLAHSSMDTMYPFGESTYVFENGQASHHKNPARLAWVKSILEEYADEFSNKD